MVNSDLYNFIVVAEELNITNASAKLFITQQTLSEQIKRLEKTYGQTFFERRPRLKLTPQGELMLAYAKKAVLEEQRLQADFDRIKDSRNFRIGYSGTKGAMILSASLPEFISRNPQTGVSLIAASAAMLPIMLESGDIDAYIISGGKAHSDCICEVLYISEFNYICRKNLFFRYCSKESFREMSYSEKIKTIARVPFSAAPKNFPLRKTLEVFFHEHGLEPNFTSSATSAAINFDICKIGQAAIVLPLEMFDQYYSSVDPDDYVVIKLPDMKEIEPLSFVCKKNTTKVDVTEMIRILKIHAPVDNRSQKDNDPTA